MVLKNPKKSKREFKSKTVRVRGYYTIIIFLALIFLDRLTKAWASGLKGDVEFRLLSFTYVTNTGAGFSILQNMNLMLIIISIIVLGLLIYFNNKIPRISLMLIVSGIVGNLIDRIFYGSVIDFINFRFWPIFNVADSLIFIGVIYWIIEILRDRDNKKKR